MPEKNKKINFNSNVSALLVILLLAAMGAFGFLYNYYTPKLSDILQHTNTVVLPVINTYANSDSDGKAHPLEAIVALEFTEYVLNVDRDRLTLMVEDALSNLDYDKLQETGNIAYVQDTLKEKLKDVVPNDEIIGVYVTELQSGDYKIATPPAANLDKRSNSAKNLFQGIGK